MSGPVRIGAEVLREAQKRPHPVEGEGELGVRRLLGPERAVVVEGSDALGGRDKLRSASAGHIGHELHNGAFGCAVVP